MYIDRPLREYLDDLAARKPAPGGGSAAALNAATGVALMSMVANYTVGMEPVLVKLDHARGELQALIDKDVEAYDNLSGGMKKFKSGSPELEDVFKGAAEPPLEICKIAAECLHLCMELAEKGNKNLITDTAIAAIMLEGAYLSAKFNVYINLKYIKDLEFIESIHKILLPLEEEMPKLKEEILERCEEVISK